MLLVFGALGNPSLDQDDILRLYRLMLGSGRHHVIVSGFDSAYHLRGFGLTFDDHGLPIVAHFEGKLLAIQAQRMFLGFARRRIRSVTRITVFGKDGLNLVIKRYLVALGGSIQPGSKCKDE